MRSADSPEDDYLASRPRDEIREERELAATLALARRWEVPASGIAHRLARIDEDDVCTWCFGSGEVED